MTTAIHPRFGLARKPLGSTRADPASRRRSVGVGGRRTRGTAKGSGQHVLRKFAARSLGRCPLVVRREGWGRGGSKQLSLASLAEYARGLHCLCVLHTL